MPSGRLLCVGRASTTALTLSDPETALGPLMEHPQPCGRDGAGLLIILSAPRSGSTWLGKIFDSHPGVLYRHEPDTVLRIERALARDEPSDMRDYVHALRLLRLLKCAGHLPLFQKNFREGAAVPARAALIHALHAMERLPVLGPMLARTPVPDLNAGNPKLTVIKSVSGCRFASAYRKAVPRAQILLLIREPFDQIASMLQGAREGRFDPRAATAGLWAWPRAEAYGLKSADFCRLSLAEQLAWHWVILNETALAGLAGQPDTMLLHYHDLASDPENHIRGLFGALDLGWPAQTGAFIAQSTRQGGRESFYRVYRDGSRLDRRLKSLLHPDDRARIAAIVQASTLAYWAMEDFRAMKVAG